MDKIACKIGYVVCIFHVLEGPDTSGSICGNLFVLKKNLRASRGKSRDGKSGRDGTGTGTVAIFPFPTDVSRPLPLLIYVPAFPVPPQDKLFPSHLTEETVRSPGVL